MTFIVGQPASADVAFNNADGTPQDPIPKVVLSSVSPLGQVIPYTAGTDPSAVKVSAGLYRLSFTPTSAGDWLVIGDSFDAQNNQTGAGISAPLTVAPRRGGTPARIQAQSIVEHYIGPIAKRTETVRLYSGADGILTLPRRRAAVVVGVLASTDFYEDTAPSSPLIPVPSADAEGLISDPAVLGYSWYDVTYSHGWADADVPQIIQTVIAALEARIAANPDGVSSERIGAGYGVSYQTVSPAWLTKDEKEALAQFRPHRSGTLVTSVPIGGLQ